MKVIVRTQLFRVGLSAAGFGALVMAGCGGGGPSSTGGSSQFTIVEASNGFGRLLPYQIPERDAEGNPTARIIEITTVDDLVANVTDANPILPPTEWPVAAVLPNQAAGNHFIYVRFSQDIDIDSVLASDTSLIGQNNMTGAISVVEFNPSGQVTRTVRGRAFVGGKTYGPRLDPNDPGDFLLDTWVTLDSSGNLQAADIDGEKPGQGFPGTDPGTGFAGDDVLVDPKTFVFVVDENGDLDLKEAFTAGRQIQLRINEDVFSTSGRNIEQVGFASSTVGADTIQPDVLGPDIEPVIIPGNFEEDVDPETNIEIQFTEPVQVLSIAGLDDGKPPRLSASVQIIFGPPARRVEVPYAVRPFSIYDLSRLELVPSYNFPGSGPDILGLTCGSFGDISLRVNPLQYRDLSGNQNTRTLSTVFSTREGVGLVNAPVVPDAVYIGRSGSTPGISVIDLYGFGGGTGNPTHDPLNPMQEGGSNFPNNPNVAVNGASLIPPLSPGTCTINGGSEGVFTLTKDSSLSDLLARSLIESIGDMAIGHALDNTFNNSTTGGCQAGGGNLCAYTGLKNIRLAAGGSNTLAPAAASALPVKIVEGGENLVLFAPSPNPPPLVFPPLCLSPLINAQEPTSIISSFNFTNLLVPGANTRGNPALRQPPTNLLASTQNSYFDGPSPSQPAFNLCNTYTMRQQIGHFLYVVDRVAAEIVILNSNRMTVIDRVRTPDPTSLALSPNLDLLAVTNENADQVSFIDTDPSSTSFHQLVRTVVVGVGPTGIAWEPGNEDIFVCNQGDGSVTVISAFSLRPRKTLRNQLTRPIDVALTPRQLGFGFLRGVYFGYIMNQDGTCAIFESGPSGANGWGYDDTVGSLSFRFFQPKAIQADVTRLNSAVWIVHENPLDANGVPTGDTGGALTNVGVASGIRGIIPFITGNVVNPQIRNLAWDVFASVGESRGLSGIPVDIAFDNMVNATAYNNFSTNFSAGQPLSINGNSIVRWNGGAFQAASQPQFMFLAVPNPGVVDVFELTSGTLQRVDANVFQPGFQSITAPNATVLADFFRQ